MPGAPRFWGTREQKILGLLAGISFKRELCAALSWQCSCAQDGFSSHCHQLAQLHSFARSLCSYCSDFKPLQICFVHPPGCSSGSTFSVLLYSHLLKLILVRVHCETTEVNPCKEITQKRSQCKGFKFPELYTWLLLFRIVCLECIYSNDGLSCWSVRREDQLLFHTHLFHIWPQVTVEGIGLWHRIPCPLLGGLLASFLPLDCRRKECLVKWRCECKLEYGK